MTYCKVNFVFHRLMFLTYFRPETYYKLPHIFCEYREPFIVVKRFSYI